jgi:TRAP-type C4-dicarboxylate transport system permease small subunit
MVFLPLERSGDMKNTLWKRIGGLIESATVVLVDISMWSIFIMMILITCEVSLRYLFDTSLLFADEISGYILLVVCFIGAAGTLQQKRHITVDVVIDRLSPRVQLTLRLIMGIVSICFLIVFCWHCFVMIRTAYIRGVRVPSILLTPEWIPQSIILIGTIFLILQFLVEVGKQIQELRGKPEG